MKQNIKINLVESDKRPNLRAFADVVLGEDLKITGVQVMEHPEKGLWVMMPSKKTNKVDERNRAIYKEVCHPVTAEFREELYGNILDAYQRYAENPLRDPCEYLEKADDPVTISAVSIVPCEKDGKAIRGIGYVTVNDSLVIHNVTVNQGEKGLFVSMPSQFMGNNEYRDYCYPITKDFRAQLSSQVLEGYEKSLSAPEKEHKKNLSASVPEQSENIENTPKRVKRVGKSR